MRALPLCLTASAALSRGMQGLAIRIARRLNARLGRQGPVFADRYHARLLSSSREVANAIRYVAANYRHHTREWLPPGFVDPLATGPDAPLEPPRLWLLRVGWLGRAQRCESPSSHPDVRRRARRAPFRRAPFGERRAS